MQKSQQSNSKLNPATHKIIHDEQVGFYPALPSQFNVQKLIKEKHNINFLKKDKNL